MRGLTDIHRADRDVAHPVAQLERGGPAPSGHAALVVAFDRSGAGRAALATAGELGSRLHADLHVVHCVDLADYPVDPDAADWEQHAARTLDDDRRLVADALAPYPGSWSYVAVRAEVSEALRWAAEEVDALMIVVGVRSAGWRHLFERAPGPSLPHRLISHGGRPVLVVGHREGPNPSGAGPSGSR